jgi:hypothetical protein
MMTRNLKPVLAWSHVRIAEKQSQSQDLVFKAEYLKTYVLYKDIIFQTIFYIVVLDKF